MNPRAGEHASFWPEGDPVVPPFSLDAVGEVRDLWESDEDFELFLQGRGVPEASNG